MTFAGLNPHEVRNFASTLRRQADTSEELAGRIKSALLLADLVDPIAGRFHDRADQFEAVAEELSTRADHAELFALNVDSSHLLPTPPSLLRGLNSVDTLSELDHRINNWQGTDNDPLLDALIRQRNQLIHERDQLEAQQAEEEARAEQIQSATADVRELLHVDEQSGWTPWHDGKARVTFDDAANVMGILAGFSDDEIYEVLQNLTTDELDRLDAAFEEGEFQQDQNWGHHAWSVLRAPSAGIKGWGDTVWDASVAATGPALDAIGTLDDDLWVGPPGTRRTEGRSGWETTEDLLAGIGEAGVEFAEVAAEGSVPFVSNGAACALGDASECAWLGVEIAVEVGGGFIAGRVIGVAGRVGNRVIYRVVGADGIERLLTLSDDAIVRLRAHLKAVREEAQRNPERGSLRIGWGAPKPTVVQSRIAESRQLVKEARKLGASDQADIDAMFLQLANGNLEPGIRSRPLFNRIKEARARNGARIYFYIEDDVVVVVAKSNKNNQDRVIRLLEGIYGE